MDWIVSIASLIVILLMTRKWKYAPICGAVGQGLWLAYTITAKQYGLIPGVIAYTIIYIIAIPKWLKG